MKSTFQTRAAQPASPPATGKRAANDSRPGYGDLSEKIRTMAVAGISIRNAAELLVEQLAGAVEPAVLELLQTLAEEGEAIAAMSVGARSMTETLKYDAYHDINTGAMNRRGFDLVYPRMEAAARKGAPLSLLIFDIDHFKRVNDTYGHNAGDAVLRLFVHDLQRNLQQKDAVVRWGGEEFIVMLENVGRKDVRAIANRLRKAVAARPFMQAVGEKPVAPNVTVSVGVAHYESGDTADTLRERADQALYAAKRAGRNRTVVAPRPSAQPQPRLNAL